jgi:hypothetical protein
MKGFLGWQANGNGGTGTVHTDGITITGDGSEGNPLVADITKLIPLTGQTFSGNFDLSTRYKTSFVEYSCNTTLTPTVSANPLIGAFGIVVINAGASAILDASNMGTKRAGSDNFTISKLNEIIITREESGLFYHIKILN